MVLSQNRRPPLTILVCQMNPTVGAIKKNCAQIKEIIRQHQDHHDLIVFPELALTGYPPEDLLFRTGLHEQVEEALASIAAITKECHVIVGHPAINQQQEMQPPPYANHALYFNAASIFYRGQCTQQYYKQKLPNHKVFDEKRYFTPGPALPCLFTINDYRLGLCICEDIWQYGPVEQIAAADADALICINASPYDYEKYQRRIDLLKAHAQKGLTIIYVNLVGGQDDLVFDGQSLVVDQKGQICTRLPAFESCNSRVTLTEQQIDGPITPILSEEANIYNALVLATRDYIKKHGFPGVLLGLSGGIDSALTLAIAVDALGAEHVQAILMPSRYTAQMSIADAQQQAHLMQVKQLTLEIEPTFSALLNTLSEPFKGLPQNTTEENLQARIRGTLLMALSNKTGNMVLTTSNKSESAVGYATLYGDMAGGFSVLKDVLKVQVYQLAVYRNRLSPVIPERVLTRPPSAELAENQTDQDSLPPYPTLDAIIQAHVENNLEAEAIIAQGYDRDIVYKVLKLIKQNEYKRQQAPPGPKISPHAFSRDWRYPITNQY